ncbi:hypothetical protein FSP39_013804 [Pinctada imbricata]|uniref:DUF6589 domain-containing protein n=1 Tax=Pinctada imbricata TaxID=66713 RepID=A0AA89CAS0_PINIB|nr:hypothetical protein FSP39_013804 [Pinctada imbricata]
MPNMEEFSWVNTLSVLEKEAPLLFSALKGTITTSKTGDSLVSTRGQNLKPILGTALSCLLRGRSPLKATFIPTMNSVQFWRGGLKRENLKQMSRTGICMSYDATLAAVDKLRKGFDDAANVCKKSLESALQTKHVERVISQDQNMDLSMALAETECNIEDEINEASSSEEEEIGHSSPVEISETNDSSEDSSSEAESHSDSGDTEDDSEEESEMETSIVSLADTSIDHISDHPGFTLCWDNVGKKVTTRHPTAESKNTYINMALGYVAVNRISTTGLDWRENETLIKATDLPSSTFVPNSEDFQTLRKRMIVIVGRIIARHISWFNSHFEDNVVRHILHIYTFESSQRSVLVNLGVFNENPSSTQGAIGIYERLQAYVPSIDGKPYPTIVYGDGLSCERGNDAQNARANGLDEWERLEGLEPAAQEFHKEMILLQDFYDIFFKGASMADRGTLTHLKNIFNYRQVKLDTSDNFNHAWELMCLTTEGYVCLLAKELLGIKNREDRPSSAPTDIETADNVERQQYFDGVCESIVDRLWHHLDVEALKSEDDTIPSAFCCGEEMDEPIVTCSAGIACSGGQYFHSSCVEMDENDLPDDWYCSDVCKAMNSIYKYCHCRKNLGVDEPMIGCSAEALCAGSEWYHLKCVGIMEDQVPEGDWFCQEKCRHLKEGSTRRGGLVQDVNDYIYNHSRALTWAGLNLLSRRDAVREADGDAMMSFWKLDNIHFFDRSHPKYLILAHRLLASINGCVCDKLKEDLIRNRTVDYGGGIGRNLPMDFMNEVLNRLFKELLTSAKGRYTDTTIQRCSQIVGPLGEALDDIFGEKMVENEIYHHRRRSHNRDANIAKFLTFLKNDQLFQVIPGRQHRGFPNFTYTENVKKSSKFQAKMKQLSKRLDRRKNIINI